MISEHPRLLKRAALRHLFCEIEALVNSDRRYRFYETYWPELRHLFSRQ
jgi:hypothetical protein